MPWAFNFIEGLHTVKRPRKIVPPQNTNMLKQINIQLKIIYRPDYTYKHRHRPNILPMLINFLG